MSSLAPIRDELMRGDLRALYLGWLASFAVRGWDDGEAPDDVREPPVPAGLAKLSAPLKSLGKYLRVDADLLKAVAAGSTGEPAAAPTRAEMVRWVKSLPTAEKDDYLIRFLAEDEDILLHAELSRRFREATAPRSKDRPRIDGRRTVAQLLAAHNDLVEKRASREAKQPVSGRARRGRGIG